MDAVQPLLGELILDLLCVLKAFKMYVSLLYIQISIEVSTENRILFISTIH
jgi:hypothetical protein